MGMEHNGTQQHIFNKFLGFKRSRYNHSGIGIVNTITTVAFRFIHSCRFVGCCVIIKAKILQGGYIKCILKNFSK